MGGSMITWNFCSFICWPFIFSFVMHSNDAEPSCPLIAHKLIRTETNRKIEVKWRKRNHSFYRYPCMNFSCIWARSKQLDFGTEIHMLFLSMIWPTKYKRFKCWLKRYAAIFFFFSLDIIHILCISRQYLHSLRIQCVSIQFIILCSFYYAHNWRTFKWPKFNRANCEQRAALFLWFFNCNGINHSVVAGAIGLKNVCRKWAHITMDVRFKWYK